jgi:hypothetical protein
LEGSRHFGLELSIRTGFVDFYRRHLNPVGLHFYTTDANRQGADAFQEGTLGHIATT